MWRVYESSLNVILGLFSGAIGDIFQDRRSVTTLNRQGGDVGTQYRSVVFFHNDKNNDKKRKTLLVYLKGKRFTIRPIVTAVEAASTFWLAENYHHDYFNQNPENQYCQAVIAPKLQKFLSQYRQAR